MLRLLSVLHLLLLTALSSVLSSVAAAQAADTSALASVMSSRVVVVRVPIPRSIREAAVSGGVPLSWRAVAGPGVRLLGVDSGNAEPSDSLVRLTLQRSPTLRVGRHVAATLQFTVGAARLMTRRMEMTQGPAQESIIREELRIPLEVPMRRHLQLREASGTVRPVVRGAWNVVQFEMINEGNVAEAVQLAVRLPQGWRLGSAGVRGVTTVYPGALVRRAVSLWIPDRWPVGQLSLDVSWRAEAVGQEAAAADDSLQQVRVDVREALGTIQGPRAELATMAVQAGDGGRAVGAALALSGPLAPGVTIDARVAMGGIRSGGAGWGLARSGLVSAPPQIIIATPHRSFALGTVQGTGALLSGAFLTGTGVATRWEPSNSRIALYAARPFAFVGGRPWAAGDGVLTGGALDRQWGRARFGVEGAHLRDPLAGRSLDAAALSGTFASSQWSALEGALGWRRHAGGQGAGLLGSYRRAGEQSTIELRLVQAPGGSRAFARAANEVELSASRRLSGGATVAGGGWHQGDDGGFLGRLRSDGWYLVPSIPLGAGAALASLDLRQSALRTEGIGGMLTHDEQQLAALISTQWHRTTMGMRASLAAVRRVVGAEALPPIAAVGRRVEWRSTVGTWLPGGGHLDGAWLVQGGTGDAGVVPRQQALSARVDRVPLPGLPRLPVTLEGDGQWMMGRGTAHVWMARGGVRLALPMGGALALQVERAPFLATARGGGVVYGLRLEQHAGLPPLRAARTHVVFIDANSNGRRDRGEAGVTGVVIQCGDRSVISDAAGRVQCPEGVPLQLDARTLPDGVLPPRGDRRRMRIGADPLALRPVRSVMVHLIALEADTFRLKSSALAHAVVVARSDDDTRWTARALGDGRFVLETMPPGRYALEIELSDIAEPLQLAAPLPYVTVTSGEAPPPVVIPLRARPVRITPPIVPGNRAPGTGALRQVGGA